MDTVFLSIGLAVGLFLAILSLLEWGRRVGDRRLAADPKGAKEGLSAIDAAIYGLLGLLLAFTFSNGSNRFDERRRQIVDETNAIGTAWLRLDLLPPENQIGLRDSFRKYVDSQIEVYRLPVGSAEREVAKARSRGLQDEIWHSSRVACRDAGGEVAHLLLLPALNAMFDITTMRLASARMHAPLSVFVMLVLLTMMSSFLAGIALAGAKGHRWVHRVGFAGLLAATVFLILDIEFPRDGLARIDEFDRLLIELRRSMD